MAAFHRSDASPRKYFLKCRAAENSGCEQTAEPGDVHVAAADQRTYPLSLQLVLHLPGGGEAKTSGRLDHQLHARGGKAHTFHELRVRHGQHVVNLAADDWKGVVAQML